MKQFLKTEKPKHNQLFIILIKTNILGLSLVHQETTLLNQFKSPPPLISGSYCTPVPATLTPYSTITKWIMCISSALNQEKNTCKEWFSSITSYSHCLHISHTKYCKYFSLKTLNINM
jgi:hypothetical protein